MFKPARLVIIGPIILVVGFVVLKLLSFTGSAPVRGQVVRELPECPVSPNCVCSHNSDEAHSIAPIKFIGDSSKVWERLQRTLVTLGGRRSANDEGRYVRYEFRSRIFGYVDDVECLLDPGEGRIEIRSASRSGYSDMGVNRKRVERVRGEIETP